MTEYEWIAVAIVASLAVLITALDLVLSLRKRRRGGAQAVPEGDTDPAAGAALAPAARREAIRRRLAALQPMSGDES